MKNLAFFLILFAFGCVSKTTVKNDAMISFSEVQHDFGIIAAKKPVSHRFEFWNTGKSPLIITDVRPSCGCTAAEWTKTVIKPGDKGFISVEFDAAAMGIFHKSITVNYNGEDSPLQLNIKGEVDAELNDE